MLVRGARFAREALAVERCPERGLRSGQAGERRSVLAGDRQDERKITLGPLVGETNLHR